MHARSIVAVALVLAALGASVAIWLGGPRDSSPGDDAAQSNDEMPVVGQERPALAAAPAAASSERAARGGCSVDGIVRAGGKPVAAKVTAWRRTAYVHGKEVRDEASSWIDRGVAPAAEATVEAGRSGEFEIVGLAPGLFLVEATTDTQRGAEFATLVRVGDRRRVEIDLATADLTLVVRAQRADGSPWAARLAIGGGTRRELGVADETGTAVFRGLRAGRVVAAARADGVTVLQAVTLPRVEPVVLTAPPSLVEVSGRVLDATGTSAGGGLAAAAPVAGATVSTRFSSDGNYVATNALSAADGAFHLWVSPSESDLICTAPGYADAKLTLRGKVSGLLIAMRRLARLSGTVVDAATKAPIAGIRVLVGAAGGAPGMRGDTRELCGDLGSATTDASGRFDVEVEATGEVEACACGAGYCSKELARGEEAAVRGVVVALEPGGTAVVTLEAVRAARVIGSVVRGDGTPVEGATVSAHEHGPGMREQRLFDMREASVQSITGEDGHFVLDAVLPAMDVDVFALVEAARAQPVSLGRLEPGSERSIVLRLNPTRDVVVTVLREGDDKSVRGATVMLKTPENSSKSQTSDEAGVATIRDVSIGAATLTVWPPGESRFDVSAFEDASVDVDVPASAEGVRLLPMTVRLPARAPTAATKLAIVGQVVGPDGVGVGGAWITATRVPTGASAEKDDADRKRKSSSDETSCESAADGSFRLKVADEGPLALAASVSLLGIPWSGSAQASAGDVGVTIRIKPEQTDEKETRLVRVLDADGQPVTSARVDIRAGSSSFDANVVDGELRVAPSANNEPIALSIHDAKGADGLRLPVATLAIAPTPFASLPAEVRLPREKTIAGVVRAPDGSPVAGAMVTATPVAEGGDPSDSSRRSPLDVLFDRDGMAGDGARSGPDGAFRVRGLGDGEFRLAVFAPRRFIAGSEGVVRARSGATGVVVTLRLGVSVVVRVVDPDGKPLANARVDALAASGRDAEENLQRVLRYAKESGDSEALRRHFDLLRYRGGVGDRRSGTATDGDGLARLFGLDPDAEYALTVAPPDDAQNLEPASVERWRPAESTLRLTRPLSTRGVVQSPSGERLAGVLVRGKQGDGEPVAAQTGADGSFTIARSAPGELQLIAFYSGEKSAPRATARATAGSQDVVLVLDPGAEIRVRLDPAEPAPMAVYVARDGASPKSRRAVEDDDHDGTWRIRGLRDNASYTVWTQGDPVALATGVRPSHGVLTLAREPARSIALRITADPRARSIDVTASRGPVEVDANADTLGADGIVRVKGLASGRWHLVVTAKLDGVAWVGATDADAGGDATVTLAPR